MKNVLLSFGLLALLLAGCSDDEKKGSGPNAVVINNDTFYVLAGSVRNAEGAFTSDDATLASAKALPFEANKIELGLKIEEGGSFTALVAGGERLSGAVSVKISRTDDKVSAVDVTLGSETTSLLRPAIEALDATKRLDLVIEIHAHNDETHLFVTPSGVAPAMENGVELPAVPSANKAWGVKLDHSALISQRITQGAEH